MFSTALVSESLGYSVPSAICYFFFSKYGLLFSSWTTTLSHYLQFFHIFPSGVCDYPHTKYTSGVLITQLPRSLDLILSFSMAFTKDVSKMVLLMLQIYVHLII